MLEIKHSAIEISNAVDGLIRRHLGEKSINALDSGAIQTSQNEMKEKDELKTKPKQHHQQNRTSKNCGTVFKDVIRMPEEKRENRAKETFDEIMNGIQGTMGFGCPENTR